MASSSGHLAVSIPGAEAAVYHDVDPIEQQEEVMYEPFAAWIARDLTSQDATSALPHAPVLAKTTSRPRRAVNRRGVAAR
jgi:hypothetical protein